MAYTCCLFQWPCYRLWMGCPYECQQSWRSSAGDHGWAPMNSDWLCGGRWRRLRLCVCTCVHLSRALDRWPVTALTLHDMYVNIAEDTVALLWQWATGQFKASSCITFVQSKVSQFGLAIFYTRKSSKLSGNSGGLHVLFISMTLLPAMNGVPLAGDPPLAITAGHRWIAIDCAADGDGVYGCVCARVFALAHACACMHACVCACVMCLQYTVKPLLYDRPQNHIGVVI